MGEGQGGAGGCRRWEDKSMIYLEGFGNTIYLSQDSLGQMQDILKIKVENLKELRDFSGLLKFKQPTNTAQLCMKIMHFSINLKCSY